jgi:hypothetical protein
VKPLGTNDLIRQVEALLVRRADEQQRRLHGIFPAAQEGTRKAG